MANSMRRVIPREELTAWERWELGTIDDPSPVRVRPGQAPIPAAAAPVPEAASATVASPAETAAPVTAEPEAAHAPAPGVPLPTAEELEAIHQQAQQEGFDTGHAIGLEAGRAEAADEVARLKALLEQLENFSANAQAELAESVLDLALVVAREVARVEIAADRQRVLPVIRELIDSMPAARAPARILAHPDDIAAINSMMGVELPSEIWRVVADPNQTPGGCRIETPISRADLSLTARWAAQLRVLKRDARPDLAWHAEVPAAEEALSPAALDALSLDLDVPADDEPV